MEKLEARLVALELAVTELRSQLERERTRIRTMRQTLQCPSCGGRRILHFRRIHEVGNAGVVPLSLNTKYSAFWGTREGDPLEAYVCKGCGLLEWHASQLDNVTPDGVNVIELGHDDPAPPSEPYR